MTLYDHVMIWYAHDD